MRRKTTKCGALFDYAEPEFGIAPIEISYPPPAVQDQVFPRREAIRDLYYYQKAEPSVEEGGQGQGQYIPYSRLTNAEKTKIEHGRDAIDQAANDGRSWRKLGHVGRYWNGLGEPHTQAPQVTDRENEAEDEIIKAEAEVIAHKAWQQDLAEAREAFQPAPIYMDKPRLLSELNPQERAKLDRKIQAEQVPFTDEDWNRRPNDPKEQKDNLPTPEQQQRKREISIHNVKPLPQFKERNNLDHVANMPISENKRHEAPIGNQTNNARQTNGVSAHEQALLQEAQAAWQQYWAPDGFAIDDNGHKARASNPQFADQQRARINELVELANARGDRKAATTYQGYWQCPEDCMQEGLPLMSHGHCGPTKEPQSQPQQRNGRWHAGYVGTDISRDGNTPTEAVNRLPNLKQQQSQSRQTQFAERPQPMDLPIAQSTDDSMAQTNEQRAEARKRGIFTHYGQQQETNKPAQSNGVSKLPEEAGLKAELDEAFAIQCAAQSKDRARFEAAKDRQRALIPQLVAMASARGDEKAAAEYAGHMGGLEAWCPSDCEKQGLAPGSHGHCDGQKTEAKIERSSNGECPGDCVMQILPRGSHGHCAPEPEQPVIRHSHSIPL